MNEDKAPVLLIIFNRPETTQQVFDAIRKARPTKLYISADAPRTDNKNDQINCEKTRKIVKNVDWDCEVMFRFLVNNLGCRDGVSSAISWAFEKEEKLIILEDDCVPSQAFFPYCNYLLDKYKDDTRVWLISGRSQSQKAPFFKSFDYVFSHYVHIWGWATWKRVWEKFNINMDSFNDYIENGGSKNVYYTPREAKLMDKKFINFFQDKKFFNSTWDFQFSFTVNSNNGLNIIPAKNLIKNIGVEGTHTKGGNPFLELEAEENFSINSEPKFVMANKEFEKFHFNNHIAKVYGGVSIYKKFKRKLFKILNLK